MSESQKKPQTHFESEEKSNANFSFDHLNQNNANSNHSSDLNQPTQNASIDEPMSPEELEAAQAYEEAHRETILADLQAQFSELQTKNTELADHFLRAKADAENARRRAEDEIGKARKFGIESFAESLLPVLDSLEAGLAIPDATIEQIREGTEVTLRQLLSALERNKVIAVNPSVGDKFDPHHHQAISVVPAQQEANTIVSVLQKGYLIADRVIRPALVVVCASA